MVWGWNVGVLADHVDASWAPDAPSASHRVRPVVVHLSPIPSTLLLLAFATTHCFHPGLFFVLWDTTFCYRTSTYQAALAQCSCLVTVVSKLTEVSLAVLFIFSHQNVTSFLFHIFLVWTRIIFKALITGWANGTQGWTQTRGRFCLEQIFVVCFSWSSSMVFWQKKQLCFLKIKIKKRMKSESAASPLLPYTDAGQFYFPSRKWQSRRYKTCHTILV